jgi:phosphatidylglycerophosphate synthase
MKEPTRVDNDVTLMSMKKVSDRLVDLLVKTPLTANQVTILNFLIFTPLIFYFLYLGGFVNNLIALGLLIAHSFFDLVDGELARKKNMQSKLGEWLENTFDGLLQTFVLFGITLHMLSRVEGPWSYVALIPLLGQGLANVLGLRLQYEYGVDPLTGSEKLNKLFTEKRTLVDTFFRNMIVPTDPIFVYLFTLRFYLLMGIFINKVPLMYFIFGIFIIIRVIALYSMFALHYSKNKSYNSLAVFKFLNEGP